MIADAKHMNGGPGPVGNAAEKILQMKPARQNKIGRARGRDLFRGRFKGMRIHPTGNKSFDHNRVPAYLTREFGEDRMQGDDPQRRLGGLKQGRQGQHGQAKTEEFVFHKAKDGGQR